VRHVRIVSNRSAWSVEAVSKHLGHANTAITEARYAQLTDRAPREHAPACALLGCVMRWRSNRPQRQKGGSEPSAGECVAPEVGLEPTTNRLTVDRKFSKFKRLTTSRAIEPECPESIAERLLQRVEAGAEVPTDPAQGARSTRETGARDAPDKHSLPASDWKQSS
jgi:hypothetical protein